MTWAGPILALPLVLAPVVAILAVSPAARTWPTAATMVGLLAYVMLLIATGLVYVGWRLTQGTATGWLVLALGLVSLQGLGVFGLLLGDSTEGRTLSGWQTLVSVPTLVLFAALPVLQRRALAFDPLLIASIAGLVLAGSRYVLAMAAPSFDVAPALRACFVLVAGTAVGAAFWALRDTRPRWLDRACGLTVALFGVATTALYLAPYFDEPGPTTAAVSIVGHLAGAVLVLGTAATALHLALRADHDTVEDLERRLELIAASDRFERERRHEIGSIVASICSASRLVRRTEGIERDRARTLEEMLDSEMARLERLIADRPRSAPKVIAVDDVLRPLVTAQQARGRLVMWRPAGHLAVVSPDVLSEVISILLENAARHAPGNRVDVTTLVPGHGRLCIRVRDHGPGVSPVVRDHLFGWQVRGPGSPGQGIGLHIARRLMVESGGALDLSDDECPGATFVVTLPAPQRQGTRP